MKMQIVMIVGMLGLLTCSVCGTAYAAPLTFVETNDLPNTQYVVIGDIGQGINTVQGTLPLVGGQGDSDGLILNNPQSLTITSVRFELLSVDPTDAEFDINGVGTIAGFNVFFIPGFSDPFEIASDGAGNPLFHFESFPRGAGEDYSVTYLLSVAAVPEPSSLALLGLGGLVLSRRRRSDRFQFYRGSTHDC